MPLTGSDFLAVTSIGYAILRLIDTAAIPQNISVENLKCANYSDGHHKPEVAAINCFKRQRCDFWIYSDCATLEIKSSDYLYFPAVAISCCFIVRDTLRIPKSDDISNF